MEKNSTQNNLIRLAYQDLPTLDRLETEFLIEQNYSVKEDFNHITEAIDSLPKVNVRPSSLSMSAILAYSRNEELEMTA